MSDSCLINGKKSGSLPVHDRGLAYGDGLFETIAIINGDVQYWDRHMRRLTEGCERLAIPMPDSGLLLTEAEQLIAGATQRVLKIIITRGVGGRGFVAPIDPETTRILCLNEWPDYPVSYAQHGVKINICSNRLSRNPALAGIKHLNCLEHVLARNEWQDKEIMEGLMLDRDNRVIEGTCSNLFIVRDSELLTPDVSLCGVAGTMRAEILEHAKERGIPCQITDLSLEDIEAADELFLTNSLIRIWPVRQVDQHIYDVGPVTRRLQQTLDLL